MNAPDGTARRSIILRVTVNGLTPILLVFSIFLTLRGHNAPGGGFAGGLVMGSVVILRFVAFGPRGVTSLRIDPIALIGAGLALAAAVGFASLVVDDAFLSSAIWETEIAGLGKIKIVSSSIFDVGVHILVVGVVMAIATVFSEADDELRRRP